MTDRKTTKPAPPERDDPAKPQPKPAPPQQDDPAKPQPKPASPQPPQNDAAVWPKASSAEP